MQTIPFSPLPGLEKTGVLAPMLPITFCNGKYEFSTFGLVDSGADAAMISTVIADSLNINWHKIPVVEGLTASGRFRYHPIEIEAEVFGNSFVLIVCIAEGINAFKCILGRKDIFKKAKITFEAYNNLYHLDFRTLH